MRVDHGMVDSQPLRLKGDDVVDARAVNSTVDAVVCEGISTLEGAEERCSQTELVVGGGSQAILAVLVHRTTSLGSKIIFTTSSALIGPLRIRRSPGRCRFFSGQVLDDTKSLNHHSRVVRWYGPIPWMQFLPKHSFALFTHFCRAPIQAPQSRSVR